MNYQLHHDRLIDRARLRTLSGYVERHHIIPRCMGGDDSPTNIVELTPEEHYVVHQLLVKLNPGVRGLVTSAIRMARQCANNKAYGWLRKRYAAARRGKPLSIETRERMATSRLGKKHSPETKAKIGAAHRALGTKPHLTPEQRERNSTARRGIKLKPFSAEHRAKIGAKSLGRIPSQETRDKISAAVRGRTHTEKSKEKISASKIGKKRKPFTRTPHTQEHRDKISAAHKARHAIARSAGLPQ